MENKTNTVSLSSSAMLSRLSIGVYTGRMLDKKVTAEVSVTKGASGAVGNYNKKLFADSPKLDAIVKLSAKVRNWHQANTLPWEDEGARLLPTKHFFDHREKMGEYEAEFNQCVKDFLDDYNNQISIQAFKLGGMFDKNEYPDAQSLANKYKFNVIYTPVPEVGDFRVDIGEEAKKDLMEQYENTFNERMGEAMNDAWGRLEKALRHVAERLSPDASGEAKVFHKSMIENIYELSSLLTKFNIAEDPKLEQARRDVENLFNSVTPKELRESGEMRDDVRNQVEELLNKMKG